jgi:GDP-L-fucose synthase
LGTNFEISIQALVVLISKLTGFKGKIKWNRSKPDGQPRRKLDVSRAKKEFGFVAQVGFQQGLKQTIEWYKQMSKS